MSTESRRKTEQYLGDLKASGKERTKLSKQLRYLVSDALDAIAETVPLETKVEVAGMSLRVHEVRSNLDSHVFMVCELREEGRPPYVVFEGIKEPGKGWYLHGDLGRYVENADTDLWLKVANHLPEIVEAFKGDSVKVIAALRRGFEVLRGMLEEQAATTDTARLSIEQFAARLRELEDRAGKFVVQADLSSGEIRNPEFAPFGPGDLAIHVSNCSAILVRARRAEDDGAVTFEPLEIPDKRRTKVEEWMAENVQKQGGALNQSGQYPVVLPLPYAVRKALGIA